jgi:hypothetical protein
LQIALLINIKWFIRLILAAFWIVAAYLAATGRGFVTWMLANHTSTSLVIVFLTFYYLLQPFYAPFFQIRKTGQGGEVLMEKSTKILCLLLAIVGSLTVILLVSEGAREAIINGANASIFKPGMTVWLGFVDWLDQVRGIYLLASGIVSGLFLAILVNQAVPRIRQTAKKIPKPYMGGPDYVPASVSQAAPKLVETATEAKVEEEATE